MPEPVAIPKGDAEQHRAFRSPHEVIIGALPSEAAPDDSAKTTPPSQTNPSVCRARYDTRHLLPSFVFGVVVTFAGIAGLVGLNAHLPAWLAPLAMSLLWAFLAAIWTFLLFRWAYRGLFWGVEVNEREVVYRRGWLWPKCTITLAELARVEVRQNWWQRLLGFGHVALIPEKPGACALVLIGITEPHILAEQITHQLRQARQQQVHEYRVISEDGSLATALG